MDTKEQTKEQCPSCEQQSAQDATKEIARLVELNDKRTAVGPFGGRDTAPSGYFNISER